MGGDAIKLSGWHSGGILTPFPATVAAGVVLWLNADQFFHALGTAATQAGGLFAAQYGSMVKRMHAGKAAQSVSDLIEAMRGTGRGAALLPTN